MFKKFKNTKSTKLISTVALVWFSSYLSSFVEWILYLILLQEIWLKLKFMYSYMYYEILIYWVLLADFSITLPLNGQCFFLFLHFFCFIFYLFKPTLFYQYLLKSLRKQQFGGILLTIYVFNLINFTNLCSLLATFLNTQETFNVVSTLLWYDAATLVMVKQRWNNVVYGKIEIHNVEQRRIKVVHFNVDSNNVRQLQNNVVIFDVEFHNVDQSRKE